MSASADHQATIVDKGIRMKIKRKSPPTEDAPETGSRVSVDDVIDGNSTSKRRRLKATKINADGLQNGSVDAQALRATGSKLPKRKRSPLNCVGDGGSRDDQAGVLSISTNGSDIGNTSSPCRDPAAVKNLSSAAVDGIAVDIGQTNSSTLYQVIPLLTYWCISPTS